MVRKKNTSDFHLKHTSNESNFLRVQVDGIYRKNRISKINTDSNEVDFQNKNNSEHDVHVVDDNKRLFLKAAGVAGLGLAAGALFPKGAEAYVAGGTPTSNVVGVKDDSNTRINPATEETLSSLLTGQEVTKLTISLAASGTVHTPGSGKKIRVYATRFSLTADATTVGFRFTAGGSDYERYVAPKTGGLYGSNNHPNFVEGGVDEVLYCNISGTTTVQINVDYLEI